jgi:hypothetical protein
MMPPGNETGRRALPPKRENRGRKKTVMRKLAFVLAAAAILGLAAPASAQSVYFGAGPGGVGVGVGPSYGWGRATGTMIVAGAAIMATMPTTIATRGVAPTTGSAAS